MTTHERGRWLLNRIRHWILVGEAIQERVGSEAPTCAAIPSFAWVQVGYTLLQITATEGYIDEVWFIDEGGPLLHRMLHLMANVRMIDPRWLREPANGNEFS
jgi:hypothetical protein